MQFKTPRIADEWTKLEQQNKKLYRLMLLTDEYSKLEFGKEVTITHLYRTAAEQIELYKDTPADKRPTTSPHQYWRAVDIRSMTYTPAEITKLLKFLNTFTGIQGKPVAIYHQIAGNALHFHVSYA